VPETINKSRGRSREEEKKRKKRTKKKRKKKKKTKSLRIVLFDECTPRLPLIGDKGTRMLKNR